MIAVRVWLSIALASCLVAPTAAERTLGRDTANRAELADRIDASLRKAGRYLIEKQSADGAWRSETYGAFRVGPTLTPYVMSSLFYMPQAGSAAKAAFDRGVEHLVGFVGNEGRLTVGPRELMFPVYTAASASRVVVLRHRSPRNLRAQQAWLAYLRGRQLNEALGWRPSDPEYGGWGFSIGVPRKPGPGKLRERFFESNLAATVFGLAALKSGRVPAEDPAYRQALVFVKRCQNFSDDPAAGDRRFDDGGFFFIPGDPVQNKAGVAGEDRLGRQRFHSYGTMTADGLRALIRCGLEPDHPRVVAARKWLEWNFSVTSNPGRFAGDRAILQDATYYYWTWAAAHAFLALRAGEIETAEGTVPWAEMLAKELIHRQQADGTWVNHFTDAKEDDPLVATPWAAATLAICRAVLTGEQNTLGSQRRTIKPGRETGIPGWRDRIEVASR